MYPTVLRLSVYVIICLSPPITALNVARHAIQAGTVYSVLAKSKEQEDVYFLVFVKENYNSEGIFMYLH